MHVIEHALTWLLEVVLRALKAAFVRANPDVTDVGELIAWLEVE